MTPRRITPSSAMAFCFTGAAWAVGGCADVGRGSAVGADIGSGADCVSFGAGEATLGERGEVDAAGGELGCVGSGDGAGVTGGGVSGGASRSAGGGSKRKSRNSGGVVVVAS